MQEIKVSCYRIQYPCNPEYLRLRFEIAWCMAKILLRVEDPVKGRRSCKDRNLKNEDTWCEVLGHYDVEFDTVLRFASWGESRDSGRDDTPHNSDGNPNLLCANRNDNGRWLNTYYDNPDNRWNRNNGFAFVVSQLTSFPNLSLRVGFCFKCLLFFCRFDFRFNLR